MDSQTKVWENRLRRAAERQGLRLERSRRRDPLALDYGLYWLVDVDGSTVSPEMGLKDLGAVEKWLTTK